MGIKVCHITTVHKAFDNRIFFKECITLREAGYDVTLLCARAESMVRDGISIVGFPGHTNRIRRIIDTSLFRALYEAKKIKAAVYHLHDPELILMGLLLKLSGKKVIRHRSVRPSSRSPPG